MSSTHRAPYWQRKSLHEMSQSEWEGLCDGCGKCCVHKLQEDDTGVIHVSNIVCRLLDTDSCQCSNYPKRKKLVPDCVVLTPDLASELEWLPSTCAYRLVAEGEDLPDWHPLKTKDPESVHRAGVSVRGRVISEREAGPLDQHLVEWPGF